MNEPSVFDSEELTLPRDVLHKVTLPSEVGSADAAIEMDVEHRIVHNVYGALQAAATHEAAADCACTLVRMLGAADLDRASRQAADEEKETPIMKLACALAGHHNIGANSTNAGLLGASLVYLIRLAGLFQWTVRQTAEMENVMVSVERLLQYTRIDSEAALTSSDPPTADWPTRGHLVLSGVTLRYRPKLPPALVRVSFEVAAGSLNSTEDELNYVAQGKWNHFAFQLGAMTGLDRERRTIQLAAIQDEKGVYEGYEPEEDAVSYKTKVEFEDLV